MIWFLRLYLNVMTWFLRLHFNVMIPSLFERRGSLTESKRVTFKVKIKVKFTYSVSVDKLNLTEYHSTKAH
jgi:hypothetical protein